MALCAQALSHRFDGDDVVIDANLRLEQGEAVALVGPNGAGKTTLLRCLAGLLPPTAGTVTLDEVAIGSMSPPEIARRISVVPQARPPAFGYTALEFVLMGFHARMGRFSLESDAQRDAALAALEGLGVAPFASRPLAALSGGEAQRVVMARTLVSGADYWLLDEPTANLDLSHQLSLIDAVRRHCDEGGTALAILHDLNLVERSFDRVVLLQAGRIVTDGPPCDALDAGLLRDVFGVPLRPLVDGGRRIWALE